MRISTVTQIVTCIATLITAITAIVVAVVAIKGFSDPLSGAIAEHILAGTVTDLQTKRDDLGKQNSQLQITNAELSKSIQQTQQEKAALRAEIQTTQSELAEVRNEINEQRSNAARLNTQVESLNAIKENAAKELSTVNAELQKSRDEVLDQLRLILVQQAALLAAQIYDDRLYTDMYKGTTPGLVVARVKPILADNGECFAKFSTVEKFTWWSLIACIGEGKKFPWPAEPDEKRRIESTLAEWKDHCHRLIKEFVIAPRSMPGGDEAVREILEFRSYSQFVANPHLRATFCK
jgi:archaellum component FlaC